MKKLVLTGAAGALGTQLRQPLSGMAQALVSTDQVEGLGDLHAGETYIRADLGDLAAMKAVCEGAEMVVHFGAIGNEAPFDDILHSNIIGAYNVWEAAYQAGVRRVIYASSIHAVGMHLKQDFIGIDAPIAPILFTVWLNALPKIWAACIGISGGWKAYICVSFRPQGL